MNSTELVRRRKGRGARDRILHAAADLFYLQGINRTGVSELSDAASVSTRTLYAHFASKDDVVEAYLEGFEDGSTQGASSLDRAELSPRDRLLGIYADSRRSETAPLRGCPFLNAGVEFSDPEHPVHRRVTRSKEFFAERVAAVARAAGAPDPDALGQQLALLYDGAAARSVALNSGAPVDVARDIAARLIDAALPTRPIGEPPVD